MQQPLFLIDVQYNDDFFRIGYLEELVSITPERDEWLGSKPPTSLGDIKLNVEKLAQSLTEHQKKIETCRLWKSSQLAMEGTLPGFVEEKTWE